MSEFIEKIREAGVVGAGGGGFPTHVKLSAKITTYIANGAECEPLLTKDIELMNRHAEEIISAVAAVRDNIGAKEAFIAAKDKYRKFWEIATPHLENYGVKPFFLEDYYPAGDEFEIVYNIVGKVIPPAGLPLDVGAAVNNVETIYNIGRAQNGIPVTEKWVTVTGEVEKPFTAPVPLGTKASYLIKLAGPRINDFAILEGGPMMGVLVSPEEPVKKTTSGFLVLPKDHLLVRYRTMPLNYVLRLAASACMQCQMCTDLCSRHLLGHPLMPHKIMRSAAMPLSLPEDVMTAAMICSECGICELVACPMGLSPRRVNQELKKRFAQKGVKFSWDGTELVPYEEREFRKIPQRRLAQRIGVEEYFAIEPEFISFVEPPDEIILPLKQHAGVPADPIVAPGERVRKGQKVADVPADKLGAPIHAPIDGVVVSISPNIVIKR